MGRYLVFSEIVFLAFKALPYTLFLVDSENLITYIRILPIHIKHYLQQLME